MPSSSPPPPINNKDKKKKQDDKKTLNQTGSRPPPPPPAKERLNKKTTWFATDHAMISQPQPQTISNAAVAAAAAAAAHPIMNDPFLLNVLQENNNGTNDTYNFKPVKDDDDNDNNDDHHPLKRQPQDDEHPLKRRSDNTKNARYYSTPPPKEKRSNNTAMSIAGSSTSTCTTPTPRKSNLSQGPTPQYSNGSNQRPILHSSHSKSFYKYDVNLLHRAIRDAGRWAYGTVFVELWALSDDQTQLFRPEGGWWVDPVYHRDCHTMNDDDDNNNNNNNKKQNCDLCRLVDASTSNYIPPNPLAPGEGLPGVLWSEASQNFHNHVMSATASFREKLKPKKRRTRSTGGFSLGQKDAIFAAATGIPPSDSSKHSSSSSNRQVVWREVKAIADDPDQPWNPRLQLMASLGLGWAAAVTFQMHGSTGVVVYMARNNVDLHRLRSADNEAYLTAAADLAGAAYVFRNPRRKVSEARRAELDRVLRRVRRKIITTVRMGKTLQDLVNEQQQQQQQQSGKPDKMQKTSAVDASSRCNDFAKTLQQQAITMLKKSRGVGVHPPPSFSWKQATLTCFGVFATLSILTKFNDLITAHVGSDYSMTMGPFGAFMTLLFGLTAAPASQPRNAIYGQLLAMSVGIIFSYTDLVLSLPIRQSMATALSISAMAKLGIIHPPAGASAFIFASGDHGWGNVLFMLFGNIIAIGSAVLINNWSNKRQYPNYWGFPMLEYVCHAVEIEIVSLWNGQQKPEKISNSKRSKKPKENFKNPEIEITFAEMTPASEKSSQTDTNLIEI